MTCQSCKSNQRVKRGRAWMCWDQKGPSLPRSSSAAAPERALPEVRDEACHDALRIAGRAFWSLSVGSRCGAAARFRPCSRLLSRRAQFQTSGKAVAAADCSLQGQLVRIAFAVHIRGL